MRRAIVLGCLLLGPAAAAHGQPVPLDELKKERAPLSAAERKRLEERARARPPGALRG
jgi:hypothetical protein